MEHGEVISNCEMKKDRRLEAVLFDMDGVIIDSEPLWSKAEQQLLARRKDPLRPN